MDATKTFAITASGDVYAWGQNTNGQLGDGTTTVRNSPVKLALSGIVAAQSGSAHTVFLPGDSTPPPTNRPPVASFSSQCSGLTCTFDSGSSSDVDGTIVSRHWALGSGGATATGTTTSFTYPTAGTYTVALTVTDDDGATHTTSSTVTVSDEPPPASSVAFRAATTASGNTTALNVRLPGTLRADDQLIAFISTNIAVSPAPPTGWTLVADEVHASGDLQTRVFTRRAAAGDAGSSVQFTLSRITKVDAIVVAYSGVQAASPIAAVATGEEAATSTTHLAPSLTSVPAASWAISYWAEKTSTSSDWVSPADLVQRAESVGSGSGRIVSLTVDSGAPVAAGTWAGRSAVSATAGRKVTSVSLALRPA
ncbi:MAG: PKD domain-containing protein [Microthrixaceae bacterium]|nr:PKD domain-containing protein [Microthrixaceae bacterium]